jgi:hypothetical protein
VTRARRHRFAALAAAVAVGGLVSVAPARAASVAGPCPTSAGVTVIVDFGSTGGGVQTRCATGSVANGFDALTKAGFSIRNVSSQPGFLCQIDGEPADDTCVHVPSAAHYWGYWYAARGEPWTYSSSGASRTPPPGSVEGWSFGDGDPPGVLPPAPIATTTTQPSTTRAPAVTTSTLPAAGSGATASTSVPEGSSSGAVGGAGTTTSSAPDELGAEGAADAGDQAAGVIAPASPEDSASGSPTGTIVGISVVLVLAGAAVVTARRRRGTDEGSP